MILEYLYSDQEGVPELIEYCNSKIKSNDPKAIEDCIDTLYEQFESYFANDELIACYFANGELLDKVSELIKKYKAISSED